jgi:large subunit ribosomal protein L12
MEYVYAALILHKLGKEISEENVAKVVSSAGVEPNQVKIKALIAAMGEVNIDEALKAASLVAPVSAAPVAAAAGKQEEKKGAEKKEEKEEVTQEQAVEGLAALFG